MKVYNRYKGYRTRSYKNCLISGYVQKNKCSEPLPFHVRYKVYGVITDSRMDEIINELKDHFAVTAIVIMNIKELG